MKKGIKTTYFKASEHLFLYVRLFAAEYYANAVQIVKIQDEKISFTLSVVLGVFGWVFFFTKFNLFAKDSCLLYRMKAGE